MKKQISPVFAAIVIIVALVLGSLYFLVQYRSNEARLAAEKAAMQRQADQMRMTRGVEREMRTGARPGTAPPLGGTSETRAPAGDEDQAAGEQDE